MSKDKKPNQGLMCDCPVHISDRFAFRDRGDIVCPGPLAMNYVEHDRAVFNEFGNRFILALLSKGEELNPWLAPRI